MVVSVALGITPGGRHCGRRVYGISWVMGGTITWPLDHRARLDGYGKPGVFVVPWQTNYRILLRILTNKTRAEKNKPYQDTLSLRQISQ